MKSLLSFVFLLSTLSVLGQEDINQKVDTSNYFTYFSKGKGLTGKSLTTNWLRLPDVAPILMEELENAGHDWLYDRSLFKIDSSKYIVLTAYSRKSNFGFLYIQGHDMFPSQSHRIDMTERGDTGADYIVCEETPTGSANFVRIEHLPKNVFPLNENNYWFQYTNDPDDNKRLVTKESAIKILRMDIRKYLQIAPRPTQ